jgi:hypothetical protein
MCTVSCDILMIIKYSKWTGLWYRHTKRTSEIQGHSHEKLVRFDYIFISWIRSKVRYGKARQPCFNSLKGLCHDMAVEVRPWIT